MFRINETEAGLTTVCNHGAMAALLKRLAVILLVGFIGFCVVDGVMYRYRVARGSAFDTVQVKQFLSVPLKNGRDELDYLGEQQVRCERTILPWSGDEPCWWVRMHAEHWTKIH